MLTLNDYLNDPISNEACMVVMKHFPEIDPVAFFTTVQEDYIFFVNNWQDYPAIIKYFNRPNDNKEYRDVVCHVILQALYDDQFEENYKNPVFRSSFEVILIPACRATAYFKVFGQVFLSLAGFDFARDKQYGDSIQDLQDRKTYWLTRKEQLRPLFTQIEIIDEVDKYDRQIEAILIDINKTIGVRTNTISKVTSITEIETFKPKIDELSLGDKKEIARLHIEYLNGFNKNQQKIMSSSDFGRLLEMLEYLIENEKLPDNITKIPTLNIPTDAIRYTFYLIQKDVYGKSRRDFLIDFLHGVFKNFNKIEPRTTYKKFTVVPKGYNDFLRNDRGDFGDM